MYILGSFRGVVANIYSDIVSKFEHQLRYYVHFRMNIHKKNL